jgi:hypothetical protein
MEEHYKNNPWLLDDMLPESFEDWVGTVSEKEMNDYKRHYDVKCALDALFDAKSKTNNIKLDLLKNIMEISKL